MTEPQNGWLHDYMDSLAKRLGRLEDGQGKLIHRISTLEGRIAVWASLAAFAGAALVTIGARIVGGH